MGVNVEEGGILFLCGSRGCDGEVCEFGMAC